MNVLKKLSASLLFAMASASAVAATDNQVFAFAEANYASLFSGTASSGQYQQYNYRYYASTGNYLAVDSSGVIYVLGPVSNGEILYVGPVSAFEADITAWEAAQGGTGGGQTVSGLMGGAVQGAPLNLKGEVTTVSGTSVVSNGAITSDGANLYAVMGNKIRKMVIASGEVSTLAGSGVTGSVDGAGEAASFYQPQGITTDGINLYVSDYNAKIRKVVIATGVVTTLAGNGVQTTTPADGTGTAATFFVPTGITTDGTYLYVQDLQVRKIEIATGVVTTLGYGASGGSGTAAGLTTDGSNLYGIYGGDVFKKVIATGAVTKLATVSTANYSLNGITTDGSSVYVTNQRTHEVSKIEISTGVVTQLAGSGTAGSSDGAGTAATFNYPFGLTTDGHSLYVSEYATGKVRKIQ